MSEEQKDDLHKVEDLKIKIFNKNYETQIEPRHIFMTNFNADKVKDDVAHIKENQDFKIENNSLFKKFFYFSIVVFIGAIGFLLFNLFFQNNDISNDNIEISVIGNTFVDGGEKLPLIIEIVNNNKIPLELADLIIEYPKGSTLTRAGEIERLRQSIGVIAQNSVINEKAEVLLFGEQGSIHQIKISLEYRIADSNAIFVKEKIYEVTINSTPVDIAIDAPTEITPNQDFVFKIKTTINDKENPNNLNMILKLDYPFGFEFIDSTPKPTLSNNIWDIEELKLDENKEITITGRMIDVYEGDQKVFHIYTGPEKSNDKSEIDVVFNSLAHNVLIKKPFVEARLSIGGVYKNNYSVYPGDVFFSSVNWVNNLDTNVDDLEIRAKFSGNAFNDESIILNQNGFYDSVNDTIIWNTSNTESFLTVPPGKSGTVSFSMKAGSMFGANGELLIDPTINIELSVSGKQSSFGNVLNQLDSVEKKTIRLASQVSLLNKILYTEGTIKNTGPFPPQAEKETTYTINLSLANTLNNVSKTKVIATLAPRVNYKEVFVPKDADIIFDQNTRELTWNVGSLKKGEGLKTPLRELSFQVSYTPSLSEVGKTPALLNKVILTGYDDFANVLVNLTKGVLSVSNKVVK